MLRKCSIFGFLVLVGGLLTPGFAVEPPLVSETVAQRHGMERAWFLQADIDRNQSRLQDLTLYEGTLYILSNSATVHAVNAETGATVWSKKIGRPEHPSSSLGVGGDLLAFLNGSHLIVVNRYNGDILQEREIEGAPGSGPAVNDVRVFIPTTTGKITAYNILPTSDVDKVLEERKKSLSPEDQERLQAERRQKLQILPNTKQPLFFQSKGRTLVQPLVLSQSSDEEFVAWPTDQGYFYIARIDRHHDSFFDIQSRMKANGPITSPPAFLPAPSEVSSTLGAIYFGSDDGFVTAIREDGKQLWMFPTGEAVTQSPIVIGDRVYFSTSHGGMFCVDAKPDDSGRTVRHWFAPGALRFLAASKKNVYAADNLGRTLVLDAATGIQKDLFETQRLSIKYSNSQTDRLYYATDRGLVQCFHEIDLKDPLHYNVRQKPVQPAAKSSPEKKSGGKADASSNEKKDAEKKSPKGKPKKGEEETPFEPADNSSDSSEPAAPKSDESENPFQ